MTTRQFVGEFHDNRQSAERRFGEKIGGQPMDDKAQSSV